jgi:hypothetical protein
VSFGKPASAAAAACSIHSKLQVLLIASNLPAAQ